MKINPVFFPTSSPYSGELVLEVGDQVKFLGSTRIYQIKEIKTKPALAPLLILEDHSGWITTGWSDEVVPA